LDEALYLADRIVLLSDGKIVADRAQDKFLDSEEPEIAEYVRAFRRGQADAATKTERA